MKQKTKCKNFGSIGYQHRLSVHEWLIYWYRSQKILIGQSLVRSLQVQVRSKHKISIDAGLSLSLYIYIYILKGWQPLVFQYGLLVVIVVYWPKRG